MNNWKECTLEDVATFQRGHDLPKSKMNNGPIPVAGSNGIIGHHNEATTKGPGITIGRSGNIGTPKLYKNDFWAHNTVLYVKDFKGNDVYFVFYFLKTIDFAGFNAGSAVPTLNRNHIHEIPVKIPPLPEQKAIAGVLSSLDDKIDLLHRQNKTLEEMAETLFMQWFVSSEKSKVKSEKLGDIVHFTKGRKPKDAFEAKLDGLMPQILIETFDTGKTLYSDPANMIIANKKDILMVMDGASSGRVEIGFEGIVGSTIGLFRPSEKFNYPLFLFYFLKINEDFIKDNTTGSAIPHADKALILDLEVEYELERVKLFEEIANSYFAKKQNNKLQIRTLEKLRDTLLPKLMSGEVRVKF